MIRNIIDKYGHYLTKQKEIIKLLMILLPFILIRIKYINFVPFWDGAVYFNGLLDAMRANDTQGFNLLNFNFANHPSMFYFLYLSLGQMLSFGNHIILNIQITLISFISIYFFYQILNYFFENNKIENVLCTLILSLCPLFVAASINVNLDFPILLFFIWFLYSLIFEKKILLVISSIALALTNFSGILLIGVSFLFFGISSVVSKSVLKVKYKQYTLVMLIPLSFLFLNYFFEYLFKGSFWQGRFINPSDNHLNNFILDYKLIFARFIQIFILNFHWILTIFILIYSVKFMVFTKNKKNENIEKKEKQNYLLLLVLLLLSLLIIFFKYKTFTNPRYIISSLFFTIFFFYYALMKFFKKYPKIRILFLCVIITLFISQNFYSIDPVSNFLYGSFKIGDRSLYKMVSITGEGMGIAGRDQIVYNTQYAVINDLINELYSELGKQNNDFIIVYNEAGNWSLFSQYNYVTKKRTFREQNTVTPSTITINELEFYRSEKTRSFEEKLYYVNLPWIENIEEDIKRLRVNNELGELKSVIKGNYKLYYCEIIK